LGHGDGNQEGKTKTGRPERWGNITAPDVPASPAFLMRMTSDPRAGHTQNGGILSTTSDAPTALWDRHRADGAREPRTV